jgi:hypothetical protein
MNSETIISANQKTLTIELAEALSELNDAVVEKLLLDNGEFEILDDKNETKTENKVEFINWLKACFEKYAVINEDFKKLEYTIDQCLHCKIGNPVILLNNGRFPVFTKDAWEREKIGLMLEFKDEMISGITFCGVFLETDNPFHFEKHCKRGNI